MVEPLSLSLSFSLTLSFFSQANNTHNTHSTQRTAETGAQGVARRALGAHHAAAARALARAAAGDAAGAGALGRGRDGAFEFFCVLVVLCSKEASLLL